MDGLFYPLYLDSMDYIIAQRSILLKALIFVLIIASIPTIHQLFSQGDLVSNLATLVQDRYITFIVLLWLIKSVSIVYPPIPGVLITFAAIPFIGWHTAYAIDILGSFTGATIAFLLGKNYGLSLLQWLVGKNLVSKIEQIRLRDKNQIEAAFVLRIAAGGLLSDGLVWGASIIGFYYLPFMTGYLLSHLLTTMPLFYLLSLSLELNVWLIGLPIILTAWLITLYLKSRYFKNL